MSVKSEIAIKNLAIETIIGILPDERNRKQTIILDIELSLDLTAAAKSCDISHTIDYAALTEEIQFICQTSEFLLIETAALAIASYVLAPPIGSSRAQARRAKITLKKPQALPGDAIPVVTFESHVADITYENGKEKNYHFESIFSCKDSYLHRIKMIEGDTALPINENYSFSDFPLQESGPHFLRVYRI